MRRVSSPEEVAHDLMKNGVPPPVARWVAELDDNVFNLQKQVAKLEKALKLATRKRAS